jgi:hypothetical protein
MLRTASVVLGVILFVLAAGETSGQTLLDEYRPHMERHERLYPGDARPSQAGDPPVFGRSPDDHWADLIDDTWGPEVTPGQFLSLFDALWRAIDQEYGAFMNLEVDLEEIQQRYRQEIAAGVSRGRFAAILNQFALALKDSHTYFIDGTVNWGTLPEPGVPLFVVGAWLDNSRFGAGLTPLPDDTLLVYKTVEDHVLGLEPGDIVLGYDGVPWHVLYQQLLAAELPIHLAWVCGSTDASMKHCFMMSAGLNWHLFETLDVRKYATGEVVHLPTHLLNGQTGRIWGNEQLPVPGVEMPDFWEEDYVTWGIVDGTSIGYIYVASWSWLDRHQISEQFRDAVWELMTNHDTTGLIIDMRFNMGGDMREAHDGYELLFDETVQEVAFDTRGDADDHYDMIPHPTHTAEAFTIYGDPATFYDRPIAVLTGPGAVSNGDWESLRTRFHPMVRTFGLPSNGAFTSSDSVGVDPHWWVTVATGSGYLIDGHQYLAHTGVQPDTEVWLTQEDVAEGRDTVVETALRWIASQYPRRASGRRLP